MEIVTLVTLLLSVASKLMERGRQTGELTREQDVALQSLASGIFARHSKPAPPPPGVSDPNA